MVLIDGVKYRPVTPENEAALEKALQSNYKHIFGPDSFCFDLKSRVRSQSGIGSLPDGYITFFDSDAKLGRFKDPQTGKENHVNAPRKSQFWENQLPCQRV